MANNVIDFGERLGQKEDDEFFEEMGLDHLTDEEREAEVVKIQTLMNIVFVFFINMQKNGLIPELKDADLEDFAAQLNFIHANALSTVDHFNGMESALQEDIDLYYGDHYPELLNNFEEIRDALDESPNITLGVDEE